MRNKVFIVGIFIFVGWINVLEAAEVSQSKLGMKQDHLNDMVLNEAVVIPKLRKMSSQAIQAYQYFKAYPNRVSDDRDKIVEDGYIIELIDTKDPNKLLIVAMPQKVGTTGRFSFCTTQDGLVRYEPKGQRIANYEACRQLQSTDELVEERAQASPKVAQEIVRNNEHAAQQILPQIFQFADNLHQRVGNYPNSYRKDPAKRIEYGYKYDVLDTGNKDTFLAVAIPKIPHVTGIRSYCITEDGIVRVDSEGGMVARHDECQLLPEVTQ